MASPLCKISSEGRGLTCFFVAGSTALPKERYKFYNELIGLSNAILMSTPKIQVLKLNLQIPLLKTCGGGEVGTVGKCLVLDEVLSIHNSQEDEERFQPHNCSLSMRGTLPHAMMQQEGPHQMSNRCDTTFLGFSAYRNKSQGNFIFKNRLPSLKDLEIATENRGRHTVNRWVCTVRIHLSVFH